jgi:hypothetical protein
VNALVSAGAAFLLAVLWFDLMFDVQVLRHRREVPEPVLASIAGYYGRVTLAARPMNRLVAVAMAATLAGIVAEIVNGDTSPGIAWTSLALAGMPISGAALHTFRTAARLGARRDTAAVQSRLARSICRDHLLFLPTIAVLLILQLTAAG